MNYSLVSKYISKFEIENLERTTDRAKSTPNECWKYSSSLHDNKKSDKYHSETVNRD